MHLNRRILIQLALITIISCVAMGIMGLQFLKLPAKLLGKAVEGLGFLWRRPDEVAAEGASA